ncbi:hypothetical protein HYQ46_000718 [Verticillium longisporum]|nr:hypothetical protein HYQ46_000718 [Verticillium longisporum]
MPTITCKARERPLRQIKTELRQLQDHLAALAQAVHVPLNRLLHLDIRPRAASVAGPLCAHPGLIEREVLRDGEDLAVVGNAVRELLAAGNVAGIALAVDAGRLLGVGLLEEALAGRVGGLVRGLLALLKVTENSECNPGVFPSCLCALPTRFVNLGSRYCFRRLRDSNTDPKV